MFRYVIVTLSVPPNSWIFRHLIRMCLQHPSWEAIVVLTCLLSTHHTASVAGDLTFALPKLGPWNTQVSVLSCNASIQTLSHEILFFTVVKGILREGWERAQGAIGLPLGPLKRVPK